MKNKLCYVQFYNSFRKIRKLFLLLIFPRVTTYKSYILFTQKKSWNGEQKSHWPILIKLFSYLRFQFFNNCFYTLLFSEYGCIYWPEIHRIIYKWYKLYKYMCKSFVNCSDRKTVHIIVKIENKTRENKFLLLFLGLKNINFFY